MHSLRPCHAEADASKRSVSISSEMPPACAHTKKPLLAHLHARLLGKDRVRVPQANARELSNSQESNRPSKSSCGPRADNLWLVSARHKEAGKEHVVPAKHAGTCPALTNDRTSFGQCSC